MKNLLRILFALVVLSAMFMVSCQQDSSELSAPNPNNLTKSSQQTNLLKRMSMRDGSDDNVLDSTSCFRIKLPVAAIVNNQNIVVNNEEQYYDVALIFNESSNDEDHIRFDFPITIIYPDYTEVLVNSDQQLDALRLACDPNEVDVPINCFSIVYPISIYTYDSDGQISNVYNIQNDLQLFFLMLNLPANAFYAINYPISVANYYNDTTVVNNNAELLSFMLENMNNCGPVACNNPHILTDDLILYMPFGNELHDLTGFSTPTITGNYHFVTDRSDNQNGAISLDDGTNNGENTIQTYQSLAGNLMQNNNFTLSLWYNRQNGLPVNQVEQLINSQAVMLMLGNDMNNGNMGPWMIGAASGVYDPSWAAEGLGAESGVWHHLVVTYEGSSGLVSLYRDGVFRASYMGSGIPEVIVGMSFGNAFKGYLDDIRGYKRALNANDIWILYNLDGDTNTCL